MLTNFNGQTITYDEIGNPLQYRDGMSFTWAKGRQLQGITKDGLNASYTYDENGLRISKTVNGVTTKIFRTNGQAVGMNSSDGKDVTFILDGDGNVYGVHYDHYSASGLRSETYYFAYNAQGDVIGIYDFSGRLMATYDYDEWGNCTVNVLTADSNGHGVDSPDHVAYVNPFRYRGYFYDAETGFYYLNSRYYDPDTGRFVNADDESLSLVSPESANYDKNCFAYCDNNPINRADSSGEIWHIVAGAVVGGVVSAAASAITQYVTEGKIDLKQTFIAAGSGALSGGLAASGLGLGAMVLGNAAISAGESILSQGVEKGFNNIKMGEVALDAGIGAVSGLIGGKGTGNKNLTNLGKQSVRRTTNALKYGGITRAKSEARKAARYYIKSTGSYYVKNYGVKQLAREFVGNIGTGFASNYFARKWGLS